MKKYLAFARTSMLHELKKIADMFGTILSFCIHITVFSFLWDFVLDGKDMAGYTKQELVWYVIIGETIMYSFNYYYRKVAYKVEMGDFAYDMTKPFNFFIRIIMEGLAEIPMTIIIFCLGCILGVIFAGAIQVNVLQVLTSISIIIMATITLLLIHIAVGLLALWLGRDVSSIWLLVQKSMLIFAFSPIELFPKVVQKILLCLPTTHIIYTPASLFVHFSKAKFIVSIMYILLAFLLITGVLYFIYKKGVKKQNVNGI